MGLSWIKVEIATPNKPEVLKMARELTIDIDAVFGKLVRIWAWFDANSVDGAVDGAVDADVDEVARYKGFADAMRKAGWLKDKSEGVGLCIPNFNRHNGESAKKRLLKSERQARWRAGLVDVVVDASPSTREEKRREEVKAKSNVGQKPDALQVLQFLNEKTGRHYEPVDANIELILARLKEGATVEDLRAVVAKKCREWAGDEKMGQYLRPATLFNRTKFAQYKGELGAIEPERRVAL